MPDSVPASNPEVLVICPECKAAVPPRSFEFHLRQRHRIYQFASRRGTRDEIVAALVEAVVRPKPNLEAWTILADIAQDEFGTRSSSILANHLIRTLDRVDFDREEVAKA